MRYIIDLETKKQLKKLDGRMARAVRLLTVDEKLYEEGFTAIVDIVIAQQISERAHRSIREAFLRTVGFERELLAVMDVESLRRCGLSRMKAKTIQRLAGSGVDFDALARKAPDDIRRQLLAFKGLGEWSVEMFRFMAAWDPHVLSLHDVGIRNAIKDLYDAGDAELEAFKDYFAPHESAASAYLWAYGRADKSTRRTIKEG